MIYRNICPICGNENPEGTQYCMVCKADLQSLPDEFFPNEHVSGGSQANPETKPKSVDEQEFDPDQPIPEWLIERFNNRGKQGQSPEKMDFDAYTNIMFGASPLENSASPAKVLTPKTPAKREKTVYQPSLESTVEAPLVEEEENSKTVSPDYPALYDFKTVRPVKKWNDPPADVRLDAVRTQAEKEFAVASDTPALWLEDAPLIEDGVEIAKGAEDYDSEFANSVSPTKVIGSEETSGMAQNAEFAAAAVSDAPESVHEDADEFKPESGSLLSDLMNEINSNAGMPAPSETNAGDQGTVFFTGSSDRATAEEPSQEPSEIKPDPEASGGSAAVLDQILRRIGYSVDDGSGDAKTEGSSDPAPASGVTASKETKNEPDPALVMEPDEEIGEKRTPGLGFEPDPALSLELDPALIEADEPSDTTGKTTSDGYDSEDEPDETEIPWDLFGSADMSLPQASDEPGYRTFSRTGIPEEDSKAETYQQRMLSSVLGKIIHAENFVPPEKMLNARAISIWSRIFWSLLAFAGVVLILMSDFGGDLPLSAEMQSGNAAALWQAAADSRESSLVVIDYTPSYGEILDPQAEKLLETLSENTDELYLSALNPASMTIVQRLLEDRGDEVRFAGWWPAGVISIRARLAEGSIPDQVWLITSESGSVRNWAEQLSVAEDSPALYVVSPGQLEPVLSVYLNAGMVSGISCEDQGTDANGNEGRIRLAVLYLAALMPVAWLMGIGGGFLKTDPDFRRKKTDPVDGEIRPVSGGETDDD